MLYKHASAARPGKSGPNDAMGEPLLEDMLEQMAIREITRRLLPTDPPPLPPDLSKKPDLPPTDEWVRLLVMWRLFAKPQGSAYLFSLNQSCRLPAIFPLMHRGIRQRASYAANVLSQIEKERSVCFFVAHSHREEPLFPSPDDIQLTRTFESLAAKELAGRCSFLGHFIVRDFEVLRVE